MAVVVTVAKGYNLGYIWKTQTEHHADRTTGGYYINAAQAGEPPGRWWRPGTEALGLVPGQVVQRKSYDAIYRQTDPRTGARLGRPRGRYPTFADHLARLTAAEPHATAERLIELGREAAQATRQPAAYTDVTIFSKSISVLHASIRENERRARQAEDEQASAIAAYREMYRYDHSGHYIGPESSRETPDRRPTWHSGVRSQPGQRSRRPSHARRTAVADPRQTTPPRPPGHPATPAENSGCPASVPSTPL